MILSDLGAEDFIDEVDSKGQLITNTICHNQHGGSHKLYYFEEEKSFHCFTGCGCNYDIFSLSRKVFDNRGQNMSFPSSIDYVARTVGRTFGFGIELNEDERVNEELDWLRRITKKKKIELPEIKYYDESILKVFSPHNNPRTFIEDHISPAALDRFGIMYYNKDSRVVLVNRHWENGKIIGLRGRIVGVHANDKSIAKYIPLTIQGHNFSFPTIISLYGLYECREAIQRLKKIIIFESEKSVLQVSSYFREDCYAVALSGSSISQNQVDIILGLGINEVQIALDREFEIGDRDAEVRHMKKTLDMARKFSPYMRTTVLWDSEGLTGFKDSPSDKGKDTLLKLLEQKQEVLNKE